MSDEGAAQTSGLRRAPTRIRPTCLALGLLVGAFVIALGAWAVHRGQLGGTPGTSPVAIGPALGGTAPGGSYTLLDGTAKNLGSLRRRPAMVWFVADGCASCVVSIPAVAQHLDSFARKGARVVVLGLYGAFGQGRQGAAALAGFGKVSAGSSFSDPAWTWGLASQPLTSAYDPGGVPDAYYLIDSNRHITCKNSVPVSTMDALLAHLHHMNGQASSHATTSARRRTDDPQSIRASR